MAKGSMTIKEVKERKVEVELEILGIINDFEDETDVRISYLSLDRGSIEDSKETAVERRGPVKNVELSMELDLLY